MSEPFAPEPKPASKLLSRMLAGLLLAFGVVLPLITLGVELTTRMNAEAFFDPLPTFLHLLLVAFVPAANLAVWQAVFRRNAVHLKQLALANGCAIGIASFYTILFLPLTPLGAIAVFYFGLGLLPLTPLLSLIVAICLRMRLSRLAETTQTSLRLWPAIAIGFIALLALNAPATLTRFGMQMATSDTVETRSRGVRWLRAVGSEDLLLRLCYVRSGATMDMVGFLFNITDPVSIDEARQIYYRVTGVPFNALPPPVKTHRGRRRWFADDIDFGQCEEAVGGRLHGLSLAASRIDGSLDGNAALGYLEWTMVFRNEAQIPREARAQIALPPGAVVSRLTLWIDGEEREAAFAARAQVRQAYESVVMRNRDPVLITTAGQDRISMQLFPVPAAGEMKIRVGMTFPLRLRTRQEGVLSWPYFHERNFDTSDLRHAVWVDSKTPLHGELAAPTLAENVFSFRGDLEDARLGDAASALMVERDAADTAWAPDSKAPDFMVRQVIGDRSTTPPQKLIVVVDGSAAMREAAPRVAKTFADLPQGIDVELLIAHDEVIEHRSLGGPDVAKLLAELDYAGGHDNTDAIARGIDRTLAQPNSALLWIHGPQPVLLSTEEALLQRLERRTTLPHWYDLQVQPGVNLVGQKLEGLTTMVSLRGEDLQPLILGWRRGARELIVQRERLEMDTSIVQAAAAQTSDHLVRLWVNDEVTRLLLSSRTPRRAEAVQLAHQYQLVTPVTGAVVLETQQQYSAAGLEPVPPGTVPTIPEPETWALIAVVLLVLAFSYRRRHFAVGTRHAA